MSSCRCRIICNWNICGRNCSISSFDYRRSGTKHVCILTRNSDCCRRCKISTWNINGLIIRITNFGSYEIKRRYRRWQGWTRHLFIYIKSTRLFKQIAFLLKLIIEFCPPCVKSILIFPADVSSCWLIKSNLKCISRFKFWYITNRLFSRITSQSSSIIIIYIIFTIRKIKGVWRRSGRGSPDKGGIRILNLFIRLHGYSTAIFCISSKCIMRIAITNDNKVSLTGNNIVQGSTLLIIHIVCLCTYWTQNEKCK